MCKNNQQWAGWGAVSTLTVVIVRQRIGLWFNWLHTLPSAAAAAEAVLRHTNKSPARDPAAQTHNILLLILTDWLPTLRHSAAFLYAHLAAVVISASERLMKVVWGPFFQVHSGNMISLSPTQTALPWGGSGLRAGAVLLLQLHRL